MVDRICIPNLPKWYEAGVRVLGKLLAEVLKFHVSVMLES